MQVMRQVSGGSMHVSPRDRGHKVLEEFEHEGDDTLKHVVDGISWRFDTSPVENYGWVLREAGNTGITGKLGVPLVSLCPVGGESSRAPCIRRYLDYSTSVNSFVFPPTS